MKRPQDGVDRGTLWTPNAHVGTQVPASPLNGRSPEDAREPPRMSGPGASGSLTRAWILGVVGAAIGALLGAGIGASVPERFDASSYVTVVEADDEVVGSPVAYAQVYSRIAREPVVMAATAPEAELDSFGQGVTISAFPDAPIIQITGSADTAELAALRANTVAEALRDFSTEEGGVSGYEVAIVTAAIAAGASASSNLLPSVAAGLILGLFAGMVAGLALPNRRRGRRS